MPVVAYFDVVHSAVGIFNSLRMLSRKPSDFFWEKEVRLLIYYFRPKEPVPDFIYIPIDLKVIIEEIVISPFADSEYLDHVKELASSIGISTDKVIPSRIKL